MYALDNVIRFEKLMDNCIYAKPGKIIEVKQKVLWDTEYVNIQYTYPMFVFIVKGITGGGILCMYFRIDTYRIFISLDIPLLFNAF